MADFVANAQVYGNTLSLRCHIYHYMNFNAMNFKINPIPFLILLLLVSTSCSAQKKVKYSVKNKKAISLFEEAMKHYRLLYLDQSLQKLDEALDKDDEFIEALTLKAQIYSDKGESEKAMEYYQKAIDVDDDFQPRVYYELGVLQKENLQLEEAEKNFNKYLTYKGLSFRAQKMTEAQLENIKVMKELVNNPVPFNPINLGSNVNGPYDEHSPSLRGDDKVLFFTKNEAPKPGAPRNMWLENIYSSERQSDGSWGPARKLSNEVNSRWREGAATVSPDGNYLIFTSCQREGGYGSCDLYIAVKRGNRWVGARNLGPQVNTKHWESQPGFAADGRTLYFSSNRPGGKGGKDIFVTQIGDDGNWSKPKSISLNTPYDEVSPYPHPDGETFYFSSDGYPGLGKKDLFVVERMGPDSFGEPVNLGYPINSVEDEVSLSVSPTGNTAYYASGMEGGEGGWDLYEFELPEYARPTPVTYASGTLTDSKSGEPVRAGFELLDLETGERIVESFSDPENGSFLVVIPTGRGFALNVSAEGYLFYSENFDPERYDPGEVFEFNVKLQRIEKGESVVLKNIFFETDSYELKGESKTELDRLVGFMENNPKLTIEIGGHTDNEGSEQYNQKLSENRAKSVYNYLVENKVAQNRLQYKGYNFQQPIATNDTEKGRAQNRRIEFKIIED